MYGRHQIKHSDRQRILPQNQDDKINTSQSQTNGLPPASKESFGLKTDFALKNGIDSSSFLRFKLENNLSVQNSQAIGNESERVFKTCGGEWRKPVNDENAAPKFYRTGENTAGTSLFDEQFYQAKGSDKWIELNPDGRLCDLPENRGKQRPENVSEFDWKGWREVSASEVPADYTTEGKQVAFENPNSAENQKSLFKRYIIDNNLVGVWDEVRGERAIDAAIQKGAKLEAVPTGEINVAGKTVYTVKADERSLEILRGELHDYKHGVQTDTKTAEKARTEANNLALDIPGAVWETSRNAFEMIGNILPDTANMVLQNNPNQEIGDHPNFGRAKLGNYYEVANVQKTARQNPFPRLDTSGAKYDFRSESMNRDENGSIFRDENGNIISSGQGKGDVTTRVAGAIAPIVIGKAIKPVESPQSLKDLGGFPEVKLGVSKTVLEDLKHVNKHLPDTPESLKLIEKEGSAHLFNDRITMEKTASEILQKGKYIGKVRGFERYGLYFKEPVGYRLSKTGEKIPLHYVEMKIKGDSYHVIPRTKPSK